MVIKAVLHNYDLFKVELGSSGVNLYEMSLIAVLIVDQTFIRACQVENTGVNRFLGGLAVTKSIITVKT